jgi:flagellar L-ring protein precursor FlgH
VAGLSSTSDFEGSADADQSNSLSGTISVTVTQVMPNGLMEVRGEKWLTLNQGEEFVQISGIIRPVDIGPDNSVPSFKVADARITYAGKGALADANSPGFLARFFMKLWPL